MKLRFLLLIFLFPVFFAQADTWTDPEQAAKDDPAFSIQGEYGFAEEGKDWGLQVMAMGNHQLEAYLLAGGLPGLGYVKGTDKIKVQGEVKDGVTELTGGDHSIQIADGQATIKKGDTVVATLPKVARVSDTMGKKAPEGAIILFDGTSGDAWNNGEVVDGLLPNKDISTKEHFEDFHIHLEFRTPYKPKARGQGRGNSGVYYQHRYETQVLDAFALEGKDNETGGIYKTAEPKHNMCLPPLTWQTYDVDFTAAKWDADGNKISNAKMTVRLNGVLIHENQEIPKPTGGGRKETPEPGPIYIQHHGNPVFYRNIWLIKK
ncbi:MAG: DUF1080 domain-containing protein [Verrucomicrobiota bacterium]